LGGDGAHCSVSARGSGPTWRDRSETAPSHGRGSCSSCRGSGTSSALLSHFAITREAGGNFAAGEGVPGYVYPAFYVWTIAPLVASIVVGTLGWLKGHRPAAVVPALASAATIFLVTVLRSYEEFGG
jgi:hypothetical protein